MRERSDNARPLAVRLCRAGVALLVTALTFASAGCTATAREAQVRDTLQAFADTSSTRVNVVADRLARQTDDLDARAALNREKLTVATMGIDNAMNPHAMTGLLDMAFQFELKARAAQQRVDRLRAAAAAATGPATRASAMDPFAEALLAVHLQNRDEIWREVAERLGPAELRGLRAMIDEWYAKNGDISRSSVQIAELKQYAGTDPSRSLVFSLVDLRDTNEQVDRIVWGAQRLYENSHWQFRRMLYDAVAEFRRPRDESIAKVAQAVAEQRERATADVIGVVHRIGVWAVGATLLLAGSFLAGALLLRSRLPRGGSALRARVESLERALAARPAANGDRSSERPTRP